MEQIKKSTIDFLSDLKRNNYRDWFLNNRSRYEDARMNFESFVQDVIDEIALFDPIIKGLGVKSCTYRINRDIRFSNDKTIYKSHLGAYIVRGGKKNGDKFAGYYLHIEPGNSMIAGGAYLPPAPWLAAIREKIDEEGEKLVRIINQKDFKNYFGEIEGEKVKTSPKGFSKDHPYIEFLRFKSFLAAKLISDKDVISANFFDHVMRAVRVLKPLNDFMNDY